MVSSYYQVDIETSITRICFENTKRTAITLFNNDTTDPIYYGTDRSIDALNSMILPPQTGMSFNAGLGDRPDLELFARSYTSTIDLRVFEAVEKEE